MLSGRYAEVNSIGKRPAGSRVFSAFGDGRTDGRNFFIMQCNALHCRRGAPPARCEKMTTTICTNPNEDDDCGGYCIGRSCKDCKFHKIIEVDE